MEHILGGCSDFCLGVWVHQHRTCCKHWLHENSWQRINIWGSRDASATVTVAHTETIEVFKHSCKSILCFYKQSELICQHNYYNGDTGERVGHSVCRRSVNALWFPEATYFGSSLNQNHLNPSACPFHTKQHLPLGPNFLWAETMSASAPMKLHWQVH